MDNDDIGYSSVAWDTYSPAGSRNHGGSGGLDNSHDNDAGNSGNNPNSVNSSHHASTGLHSGLFSSDDEEDNDHLAAASSVILPAETSAWAEESLDSEVIDIHDDNHAGSSSSSGGGNAAIHAEGSSIFYGSHDHENEPSLNRSTEHEDRAHGKSVNRGDITHVRTESDLVAMADERLVSRISMEVSVPDYKKVEGGSKEYISYKVVTKTDSPDFGSPDVTVFRRFQDFVWLHAVLSRDYPSAVIPPLPDKQRMRYVRGDRFSEDFITKRRDSLERFLRKIAVHPTLQRVQYVRVFLESHDFSSEQATQNNKKRLDDGPLDTIGDALLNAFAKIKKPDQRFVAMRDEVDKFEDDLQTLEKLEQRILKRQEELEMDYREFGGSIAGLGSLETGITHSLHRLGLTIADYSTEMHKLTTREDAQFLSQLHDCLAYCNSVKNVLKIRDQKQLDFEELSDYLQQQTAERQRLLSNGRSGSSSIGGFFQQKMDEIKGVDQERARQEKLKRVEDRMGELTKAVDESTYISEAFSNEAAMEFKFFQLQKTKDLRQCLLDYSSGRVDFFEKSLALWDDIIPELEKIGVSAPEPTRP
ncbi:intercellular trafficking and secretion [Lunasporangiospora selenospora]|uniref:Sorting nexin-4 n=1 Tax=Lunasporangiospora selenospora TaxID=979761 RepID=A0A9P6G0R8_9FUNG|nr:intercellular trafficking and secretion [Lunasporangiospora selenospora]